MGETDGAYAAKAGDTDFRKKWDKEAYAEKARKRDMEEAERMQENEARLKQGKMTPFQCLHYQTDKQHREETSPLTAKGSAETNRPHEAARGLA